MEDTSFKHELSQIFESLNTFIEATNTENTQDGARSIPKQLIRLVGQTALLLGDLPFTVAASMDLDVVSQLDYVVSKKLAALLSQTGLTLETDGHLIWMPAETVYETIFEFSFVEVQMAKPEYVVASKFKFKRHKDELLIKKYLEHYPDKKDDIKKMAGK